MGQALRQGLGQSQEGTVPTRCLFYLLSRDTQWKAWLCHEWMAPKLNSPNVRVRLRALETWARSAPPGAVDPLILAFEDKDERVRARAQQLIEQDWARKAERQSSRAG